MINVLLICSGGMSTSMLAKRMQNVANQRGIKANIWATGDSANILAIGDSDSHRASKKADIILLGPQVRYQEKDIQERVNNKIPVSVINMQTYGSMNGELALDSALNILEEFNK